MSRHSNADSQHIGGVHRNGLHVADASISPPGSPMEPGSPGSPETPGMPEAPQRWEPEPIPGGEPAPYAPDENLDPDPMTGSGQAF
jgi:hypothetical protein